MMSSSTEKPPYTVPKTDASKYVKKTVFDLRTGDSVLLRKGDSGYRLRKVAKIETETHLSGEHYIIHFGDRTSFKVVSPVTKEVWVYDNTYLAKNIEWELA